MFENYGNNNGMYMPVAPAAYGYGGNSGFGGDMSIWFIVLLLLCGWGGNGMMGMNGGGLYPWLNQSNQINDGFRDQMINGNITGIQNAVTSGFGDVQTALCGGFAGVNASVNGAQNAIAQQLYTGEIAQLNRSFAEQTANAQGFNGVQAGLSELRYTEATEGCATRNNSTQNTQMIINAVNTGVQSLKDQMFNDKLDAKNEKIADLERKIALSDLAASQTAQTLELKASQTANNDLLYNRFAQCPVNTVPVYGPQPVYTCNRGCNNGGLPLAS